MTGTLEKLVRPFQSPASADARRIPSQASEPVERVVLQIGRQGSGKQFSGSYSLAVTHYCEAHRNELRFTDLQ